MAYDMTEIALRERITELEQSFDLYDTAVQRGTEMWRKETGRTDILPDTAKLVAFLITRLTALEAELDSTRKTVKELVNRNNITQAKLTALRSRLAEAEQKTIAVRNSLNESGQAMYGFITERDTARDGLLECARLLAIVYNCMVARPVPDPETGEYAMAWLMVSSPVFDAIDETRAWLSAHPELTKEQE